MSELYDGPDQRAESYIRDTWRRLTTGDEAPPALTIRPGNLSERLLRQRAAELDRREKRLAVLGWVVALALLLEVVLLWVVVSYGDHRLPVNHLSGRAGIVAPRH